MYVGVSLGNPLLWIVAILYFMVLIVVVLAVAAGAVVYGVAYGGYRGIVWLSWRYRRYQAQHRASRVA
jgi:hypothetical protein